ncbi:MAG: hypothetical protein WA116_01415 [Anaerolineaceae bacterium]
MNKPKKIRIYLIILVALIVFFIALPRIVDNVSITEGSPIEMEPVTLESTDLIRYSVDRLDPITVNGQDIFYLWGWSFLTTDMEQGNYDIYLVFKSDEAEYYYLTESFERPDLQKAFPEVEIDLSNSGFKAFIAKEKIEVGEYAIGIIYKNKSDGTTYYQLTNKEIVRTPNTISLEIKQ